MGYLFLMTFAGSALFIGYLCWEKMLKKSMTQCMKYKALLVVMLAYAVPWIWVKGIYRYLLEAIWPGEVAVGAKGLVDIANIETTELAYQTKEYQLSMLVVVIWFTIGLALLLVRIVRYLMKRHPLRVLTIKCGDENLELTLKCLSKVLQCKRAPEVVWTRVDNETFTIGAIKPMILLQKKYADGELYWILKHEMMHIVSLDLWMKLLAEFICCLHWFNPLVYFLEHKVNYLSETSCDEKVIRGCTDEECERYINLLDKNKGDNKLKFPFGNTFRGSGVEVEKRIALMKCRRSIKNSEKAVAMCTFGLLIFLDSLTALAYPDVHLVKNAVIEAAEDAIGGNNFWTYDCAEDGYGLLTEVVLYDVQFVDEDGQIHPATYTEEIVCDKHNSVSGIVQIHVKEEDGSCIIETYEGSRCTKCGDVWRGEFLHETEKSFCAH